MIEIIILVLAIVFIVASTTIGKLHPFIALLIASFGYGFAVGMPVENLITAINSGFGDTIAAIGIVIIAGSIIGTFLHRSGGASELAGQMVKLIGIKRSPVGMGIIGYIVSMPVFCDAAYVLLSPVNRAIAKKAGIGIAAGAIALSLGLYVTHTMVPPTPGPVAAAGIMNADLGLVIVWGLLVSLIALAAGLLFAVHYGSKFDIDALPDDLSDVALIENQVPPPVALTLLPIFIPILLIVLSSLSKLPSAPFGSGTLADALQFFGQPSVALLIGVAFAILLPRKTSGDILSEQGWIGEAIRNSALIIVITGAGGAFGRVLKESGIASVFESGATASELGLILPFLIAAAIKTAQGSSTVAIITTAGIISPLLPSLGLDSEHGRALAVVAIGGGSMMVSHANDSYFWVVTQFSGMNVKQGYQLHTLGTLVTGIMTAATLLFVSTLVL